MIPNRLLGDTATLTHVIDMVDNGYDDVNSTEVIELTNIAFDIGNTYERQEKGAFVAGGDTLMFYDLCNSKPKGVSFTKLDTVTYNGKEYTVQGINKARTGNMRFSHIEVSLKEVTND